MSASRPKHGRIIVKKPPIVIPEPKPVLAKTTKKVRSVAPKQSLNGLATSGSSKSVPQERSKARVPPLPRSTPPPPRDSSSEDDDDFEEVIIPSDQGPNFASSSYPGTPTTPAHLASHPTTPGTITTNPSVDYDYAGYGDEEGDVDGEEDEEGGGGVLRIEIGGETPEEKAKRIALALRKKPMTSKDRAIRLEAHKTHVIALLASAKIRNKWCTNPILKARLLSLLPHPLVAAFTIPPSRYPDKAKRSRLFFEALQNLVTWWTQSFFDISDDTLGLRTRPWDEVEDLVKTLPKLTKSDFTASSFLSTSRKGKGKAKDNESDDKVEEMFTKMEENSGGERLRSVNSLMKKVLQQEGSRDVSAQLFVALCRACGLGARLVVSLQPVPWRAEKVVHKTKKKGAGKGGKSLASRQGMGSGDEDEDTDDDDDMEEVPIPLPGEIGGKDEKKEGAPDEVVEKIQARRGMRGAGPRRLQDPADLYRLKKVKPPPQKVGSTSKPKPKKEELSTQPPVFWAEVFSRSDQRWIPVDPLKAVIRKKSHYEPSSDNGPIRMTYVVGFEEDGYARDVTLRYAKNFGAKTVKLRVPSRKDEPDWWGEVVTFMARPYRLNRDDLEDAEFETSHLSEGMPMHMNGFKDHPIYVLERHLKREEVILPKKEIGRFRGEPVFRRSNVLSTKTAENWMRIGRKVKERQEPLKWVKQRAVTLQKRRQQELAVQEGGEPILQGLYGENQTEVLIPPPIVDGKIPQNSFGNIDLYVPTMLPAGAVHLPFKGIAKVAKQLGISYAEACTGFEFKKQRAIPVITGIVVASDQETMVMEAYYESNAAAEERARVKQEEKALKRWTKLVNGLRVRQRLRAEYGNGEGLHENQHNPMADPAQSNSTATATTPAKPKASAASVIASANQQSTAAWAEGVRSRSPSVKLEPEDEVVVQPVHSPYFSRTAQVTPDEAKIGSVETAFDKEEPEEVLETVLPATADDVKEMTIPVQSLKLKLKRPNRPSPSPPENTKRPKRKAAPQKELKEASDVSEDEHDVDTSVIKQSRTNRSVGNGRAKRTGMGKKAVSVEIPTRSLRTRGGDVREKIRAALRSDDDDDAEEDEESVEG